MAERVGNPSGVREARHQGEFSLLRSGESFGSPLTRSSSWGGRKEWEVTKMSFLVGTFAFGNTSFSE